VNNYKKIILNNGIPLYLYNDKSLKQVFVNYIVKYGSSGKWFDFNLDNKQYHVLPGYAHYLEHLLGEHSKYGNMYTNFSDRCYYANAYTGDDHTSYYFYGVDNIKKSIKELIEAIDCPVFDDKDVEHSRCAIEEEASMWSDRHNITAVSLVEKNLYAGFDVYDDTLSCIGDRKTTKEINTRDLYNCYNAFYSDDNKVLVVAGNVNEEELVDYLNEIYSKTPNHKKSVIIPNYDVDPIRKREDVIYRDVESNINSFGIKIKRPSSMTNEDLNFCIDFLGEYLYGNDSEFLTYLKKNNLLDVLYYCYSRWNDDYINFVHSLITSDDKSYYNTILEKLNSRDINREDFELIRKGFIAEELMKLDDKYDVPSDFGHRMCYTENYSNVDYYRNISYDNFMDMINKLDFSKYTMGQVKKLCK